MSIIAKCTVCKTPKQKRCRRFYSPYKSWEHADKTGHIMIDGAYFRKGDR